MNMHEVRDFINHESELLTILRHLPPVDANGPWVAGGSVWKAIENIPIESDIDFFFQSAVQCERWYRTLLSMPYVHRIVSTPKANDYNTTLKYHVHSRGFNKTVKIQLVTFSFFKDIEELLNGFDFTACQFGYDGEYLYSGDTSFDDLRNREIIFNNIRDNYATAIHLEKYVKLGFKAPESQKQKFDEIMALRKPKYEEKPADGAYRTSWYSNSVGLVSSPQPVRTNEEDEAYPRPSNIQENQGINLVRATEIPRRPARQTQPQSLWDMPAPVSGVSPLMAGYATNTVNTSYYTTVDMGAESPAAPNPPLAAEVPITYDNTVGISVNPLAA